MRLIDADDLVAKIMMDAPGFMDGGSEITKAFIMAMVKTRSVTPTIDAVSVVRCRECKWYTEMPGKWVCELYDWVHEGDWFCADGEQK